jgi:DNA-binding NarL/FixJ family response regulator
MPIIRVLVVEDYEPMRQFVRARLQKRCDLQVVGEASDGLEAVQKAMELKPDLVLMDIGLPYLNGIEAARQIRELVPDAKIIFLTLESADDVVEEAFSLGALGYVFKISAGIDLLSAIEAVVLGRQFVSGR